VCVYVRVKTYMLADRVENLNTAQIRDPEINLVLLQCFHLTLDRIHTQTHRIMLSAADNVSAEHTDKTQCCSASEMMTSYNMQEMIIRAKTERERETATNTVPENGAEKPGWGGPDFGI